MDTKSNQLTTTKESELSNDYFLVVHPLDDYPEEKAEVGSSGAARDDTCCALVTLRPASLPDPDDNSVFLPCDRPSHSYAK